MIDTVESSLVKVREHRIEDLEAYLEWQCDERVGTHLSWLPRTKEEAKESLLDAIAEQTNSNRQRFFMAIVRKEDEEVVGDTGIMKISATEGDMGWFLRPGFEGYGYAVEGARLMVSIGLGVLGFSLLRASCHRENWKSERIMKKLGFKMKRSTKERLYYILEAKE